MGNALLATGIDTIAVFRAAVIDIASGASSQGERGPGTGTDKWSSARATGCDVDDVGSLGVSWSMRCNVTNVNYM